MGIVLYFAEKLVKHLTRSKTEHEITPLAYAQSSPVPPSMNEGERALAVIRKDHPIVMVLGRAGTGKTTLIRSILEKGGENQVVLAPTGIAAVNAGGQTIHSFFGIPPRMHNLSEILPKHRQIPLFRNLRRLIIDEVSMVRADLLDAVDHSLRINREVDEPFGGVQLVLVGDFLQLPPVVKRIEEEFLKRLGYAGPYAFNSKSYSTAPVTNLELSTIYRQVDPEFIRMLGELREGNNLKQAVDSFNKICLGPHRRPEVPVVLAATNAVVDLYNRRGLDSLPGNAATFNGVITGDFLLAGDKLPVQEKLLLKIGSRVMTVRNDPNKNWVNGSLGTVQRVENERVWIKFDGVHDVLEVSAARWESVRFKWDSASNRIVSEIVGTYSQIPIIPAWALTIHKAQGLTLENARVDLQTGAFASGQAYVALSRVRSLDGLSLTSPLSVADVKVDQRLVEFIQNRKGVVYV